MVNRNDVIIYTVKIVYILVMFALLLVNSYFMGINIKYLSPKMADLSAVFY